VGPWACEEGGRGSRAPQKPDARDIAKNEEGEERMEGVDGKAARDYGFTAVPNAAAVGLSRGAAKPS
jgi:hypothetical protein